jgi:phospholipase C
MKIPVVLGILAALSLSASAQNSPQPAAQDGHGETQSVKNVVIIVKENHSFDNYFGLFPGANGASTGNTPTGTVPLTLMGDRPKNCTHSWQNSQKDIAGGLMDGFYKQCGSTYNAYVQADESVIPNYWSYAQTYALNDNTFQQLGGPSFPNHAMIAGETSNDAVDQTHGGDNTTYGQGCDAAARGATVGAINPTTGKSFTESPCFTNATIMSQLDAAGVSWRIYSPQPGVGGYGWNFGSYYQDLWYGTDRDNDVDTSQFCTDIAGGNMKQVSWLTPSISDSEHPNASITNGENWTVTQINCVMNSSYWANTLIVVAWDDWGGFYDHVVPPVANYFGYGMRVPLLVISPFAKPAYVGHVQYSFDSLNKEIETVFNVSCLLTDCSTTVNDLSDMLTDTASAPTLVLPLRPHVEEDEKAVQEEVERDSDD